MTVHRFATEQERLVWELTPRPGWIASPDGPLMAWYHPPARPSAGPAVLLCDTLGSDRMNLHLAYRHLALQLAWAGFPVLRIDYAGTGDSAGGPRDPGRLGAWLRSLGCGADHLRSVSGASELVVFGALFGASLGAALASQRADVTGLVAWGGYARGREFVRELRAVERLSSANPKGRRPASWQDGDLESLGFLFTAETVRSLEAFDLAQLGRGGLRRVCLLPWDEHERDRGLGEAAEAWGVEVERHPSAPSSGSASLERQAVPDGVIAATLSWLAGHASAPPRTGTEPAFPSSVRVTSRNAPTPLVESCLWMGAERSVFGILTEHAAGHRDAPDLLADAGPAPTGVILVNGGNNHRAGINRNYTQWARAWAGEGVSVLRLDIRGLGDSPPARARDLNVLYRAETAGDVIAAMDWLERHRGIRRFVLGGLCGGAFQALHAARRDRRVVGLWLLELLRFYHEERSWHVRLSRRLRRVARRSLAPAGLTPAIIDTPLGRWLRAQCAGRGVRVLALYRRNEPMRQAFHDELATAARPLARTGRFKEYTFDESNHIFSPLWSQEELGRVLADHLAGLVADADR